MFERFTERARQVVILAQEEARTLKHEQIGTEHILLGLLRVEDGLAAHVLQQLEITADPVRIAVTQSVGIGTREAPDQLLFSPHAKRGLELALREALSFGHEYVGTEHILLGLTRDSEGGAAHILLAFGADADKIRADVISTFDRGKASSAGGWKSRRFDLPQAVALESCQQDGCAVGAVVHGAGYCAAHLPRKQWEPLIARHMSRDQPFEGRGVLITQETIEIIVRSARNAALAHLGRGTSGVEAWRRYDPLSVACLPGFRFDGATFSEDVDLRDVVFLGPVSFAQATFLSADFSGAEFHEGASFSYASFAGSARFVATTFAPGMGALDMLSLQAVTFAGAEFNADANFSGAVLGPQASFARAHLRRSGIFRGAKFGPTTSFEEASIGRKSSFSGATFERNTRFDNASLADEVDFDGSSFADDASFRGTRFGDATSFEHCIFGGAPSFAGALFGRQARLGPCRAAQEVVLDRVTLGGGSHVAIRTGTIVATGIRVTDGAAFDADCDVLLLEDGRFEGPTTIGGAAVTLAHRSDEDTQRACAEPEIPSLRGTNVVGLSLADVSLRGCRFFGAHNLDRLRFGPGVQFDETPRGWFWGRSFPPVWRWVPRQILADEAAWRTQTNKGYGWLSADSNLGGRGVDQLAITADLTIDELNSVRGRLEERSMVAIEDEALEAAASYAGRLSDRDQVDGSIDLLEGAIAYQRRLLSVGTPEEQAEEAALATAAEEARKRKEDFLETQEFEQAARERDRERQAARRLNEHRRRRTPESGPVARTNLAVNDIAAIAAEWTGTEWKAAIPEASPAEQERSIPSHPREVAGLYRALRSGREGEKDSPGAADFYYGEMEMRRHASTPGSADRGILAAYWLAAGYGLRASRAIALLFVTVAAAGLLFFWTGFEAHSSLATAEIYAAQSAVPGLSVASRQLTDQGELVRIGLHVVGPILLGLTLLSMRGRVQR